jgi:phage tail-like protein
MRNDPFVSFKFLVEIDHVQHGGFARAKGVSRELKVDVYHEGGRNDFEHKLVGQTVYGNLVLERGLVDRFMWDWHDAAVEGTITRRDVTLILRDATDAEVWRWIVDGCVPVKWSGSDLDAGNAQVLVESIELAHRGFRRGN